MNEKYKLNYRKAIKNGLFAGIASITSIASYPLEVVKIRCHVLEERNLMKDLIKNMLRSEGLKSFYKGINQNLLLGFFGYGTVFLIYELVNEKLNFQIKDREIWNSVFSSMIAGIMAVIITSPFNFVKTRQILSKEQIDSKTINNMTKIVKDIYKETNSIFGFWKALNPSLITSFYSTIQISSYLFFKKLFLYNGENLKLASLCGVISRCIACTLIYPFTLLRSRILNYNKNFCNTSSENAFYRTSTDYKKVIRDIKILWNREGVLSLFQGLKFELLKVSINGALFFYFYEYLLTAFK